MGPRPTRTGGAVGLGAPGAPVSVVGAVGGGSARRRMVRVPLRPPRPDRTGPDSEPGRGGDDGRAAGEPGASGSAVTATAEGGPGPGRGRWAGERLPLWLRLRCGAEPRTLAALAFVLLVAVGFAVHHFWHGRPETVRAPRAEGAAPALASEPGPSGSAAGAPGPSGTAAPARTGAPVTVDVAGKVRRPGIHTLPPGSRVADALRASGGLKPGTETEGLNRARLLVDGEQIVAGAAPASGAAGSARGAAPTATGPPGAGPSDTGARISLSSATVEELETLPGVGPVLAQHIVDYRTEHGGFRSVEELREVSGIGEARFAELEPRVGP